MCAKLILTFVVSAGQFLSSRRVSIRIIDCVSDSVTYRVSTLDVVNIVLRHVHQLV